MNATNKPVAPTNEVVGAYLTYGMSDKREAFLSSPKDFIFAETNCLVSDDVEIRVVENTTEQINLILPYYASFEKASAEMFSDEEMGDIAGGEILGLIIGAITGMAIAGGIAAASGVAAGTTVAGVALGVGAVVGGVTGSVVVGTAIGAGTAVGIRNNRNK